MSFPDEMTVLLPVDISGEHTIPTSVLDLLSSTHVIVLGYYPVPSQAAPAQLKHQHQDDAKRHLDAIANQLSSRVDAVTDVLVFTHDRDETVDRIATTHDVDAILTPGEVAAVDRLLVPLRGDSNVENILSLVVTLLASTDATVTLFHATDEAGGDGRGDRLLDGAISYLVESGIDPDRIDRQLSTEEAVSGILAAGDESDVLVIGETEPSLLDRILGHVPSRILDDADGPVFVVRDTSGTETKDGDGADSGAEETTDAA